MLRAAASRGLQLAHLAKQLAQGPASRALSSTGTAPEGSSVASLISAVKSSSSGSFAAGGLSSLKAGVLQPHYPVLAAPVGLSPLAKLLAGSAAAWVLYRINVQATSHEWIVDLSLDVLQAAWLISFASFLPFRSVYMSLRSMAPHTTGPLRTLQPAALLK